jgi:hypothetical protein
MNNYPDVWVVVKLTGDAVPDGELYKILAGWYGGYTQGNSWKLNSGITSISEKDNNYYVEGYSGSLYVCHKDAERLNMTTQGAYNQFHEVYGKKAKIEIVEMKTILNKFKK